MLELLSSIAGGVSAAQKIVEAAQALGHTSLGEQDRQQLRDALHPSLRPLFTVAPADFLKASEPGYTGG